MNNGKTFLCACKRKYAAIAAVFLLLVFGIEFHSYASEISWYPDSTYCYTMHVTAECVFNEVTVENNSHILVSLYDGCETVMSDKNGKSYPAKVFDTTFNGVKTNKEDLIFNYFEAENQPACGNLKSFTWTGSIRLEKSGTDPAEALDLSSASLPLTAQLPSFNNSNLQLKIKDIKVYAEINTEKTGSVLDTKRFNRGKGLKLSQKNMIRNSKGDVTVIVCLEDPSDSYLSLKLSTDLSEEWSTIMLKPRENIATFVVPISYFYIDKYDLLFSTISILTEEGNEIPLKKIRMQFSQPVSEAVPVKISCGQIVLNQGVSFKLSTSVPVTFSCPDASIVSVDKGGTIIAKNTGYVTVTAADKNGQTASCQVTVISSSKPASDISFRYKECIIRVGKKYTLPVNLPEGCTDKLFWHSSDPSLVSVDPSTGKLTANAPGTATVTVYSSSGTSAVCSVTVKMPD